MFLQGGVLTKRHSTKAAFETASLFAPMSFHVPGQFTALCTGVGTQLTLVWLLSCVTSPVYGQVAAVLEDLATKFTGAGFGHDLLAEVRVEEGPYLALLHDGPYSTRFHRWQAWRED